MQHVRTGCLYSCLVVSRFLDTEVEVFALYMSVPCADAMVHTETIYSVLYRHMLKILLSLQDD